MCSHHACNHQVTPCATIIQLSCLGTTAAGFTGMPRQLPVPAGTSCTGPSRARALELKKQLLVVNSMDYSPKQLVSSAGLDATKTATHQQPTLCLFVISREIPSCSQKVNTAWNAENPSKACLGWHFCKHVQHLQFSDSAASASSNDLLPTA